MTLEPPGRADAPSLIAANIASRAFHEPWAQPFIDQAGFDAWFAGIGPANASLVARAEDGVIGVDNISQIFLGNFCSAYLGFYGMAAFAGQGLMTEAVRRSAAYAFEQLGLHRLEANIQPGNARSIALVRRVGFRKEGFSPAYLRIGGVWRDHERWALISGGR
jgi:ribosomal-protein-alanine N-acetyltransferase